MSCRALPHFTYFHCTRRHYHTVDSPPNRNAARNAGGGAPRSQRPSAHARRHLRQFPRRQGFRHKRAR
jgi:hypothetical protein